MMLTTCVRCDVEGLLPIDAFNLVNRLFVPCRFSLTIHRKMKQIRISLNLLGTTVLFAYVFAMTMHRISPPPFPIVYWFHISNRW